MTYSILGGDQQTYGPYTKEDLRRLVREGRVNGDTLVIAEDSEEWRALKAYPELKDIVQAFGTDTWEKADPEPVRAAILAGSHEFPVKEIITAGWEAIKANYWNCFAATAVVMAATMGVSIVASFIPFVGGFAAVMLQGAVSGGAWIFFLKQIRKEKPVIEDAFRIFHPGAIHLAIAAVIISIVSTLVILIISLPFFFTFLVGFIEVIRSGSSNNNQDFSYLFSGMGLLGALGFILAIIAAIFITSLWIFAPPLILDKHLDFWQAMELSRKVVMRRWIQVVIFVLANGLIMVAGLLACCFGMLFAAPLVMASFAIAYDRNFGDGGTPLPKSEFPLL